VDITASRCDTEDNGFATGLTNCLTRDSQGVPTSGLSWPTSLGFAIGALNVTPTAIQGLGPIAATFLDATPDASSWTTTLSGPYTSNPTGTVKWKRIGNFAMIYIEASITGTATGGSAIFMSGIPASITPSQQRIVPCVNLENNGVQPLCGSVSINTNNTASINLASVSGSFLASNTAFTGSGTTGLINGWSAIYPI